MTDLTLYHNDMSTCSQKVRLVLAEKKLAWESVHLRLREGDQHEPQYLALNPRGVVPTLVHDGRVIRESQVILEYVDEIFAEPPLRPADPYNRAHMRLWTKQFDEDLQACTAVISMCIAFRHQFLKKAVAELEAYLHKLPDPSQRDRLETLIQSGTDHPQFAVAIRRYARLFTEMEAALSSQPWLSGADYSLADLSYTPYLTRFEHLHLLPMLDRHPQLRAWYDRVKARESYQLALTRWENPAYFDVYRAHAPQAWPRVEAILTSGPAAC